MVDSIYIQTTSARPGEQIVWSSPNLSENTGYRTGNLNNLKVRQYPDGKLRISGSLPKYLAGSNVETLTREGLIESLYKLEREAGIMPEFTRVFRLDIAASLSVPRKAVQYMAVLGERPRFEKWTFSAGVMYKGGRKSLSFYDKEEESGIKGNLLRVELKFKKKLKEEMGFSVFLSDLYRQDFFESLVARWLDEYNKVQKIRRHILEAPSGTRDLSNQLCRIAIECLGGEGALLKYLSSCEMDKQVKSRCRRMVRELCESGNLELDQLLIEEMDTAVQAAVGKALRSQ